jgi:transcriptional regulator with XRE-family HTH domain
MTGCEYRMQVTHGQGRRDRQTPRQPPSDLAADFWADSAIDQALAERHFGRVLRAYRHHPYFRESSVQPPLSQETLGAWLGLSQSQLSRVERGERTYDIFRMSHWARTLRIPPELLWFEVTTAPLTGPAAQASGVRKRHSPDRLAHGSRNRTLTHVSSEAQSSEAEFALLPTPALDHHLDELPDTGRNPVRFTEAALSVAVSGAGSRRSCRFIERYSGASMSQKRLDSLLLKADTDFYAPPRSSKLRLYDLLADPERQNPVQPINIAETPYQKRLRIPFAAPGLSEGDRFSLELEYAVAGVVNAYRDYWFFDPTSHALEVETLRFGLEWSGTDLREAFHVQVARTTRAKHLRGRLPLEVRASSTTISYEVRRPDHDFVDLFVLGTAK